MGYWSIVPPGESSACDLDSIGITVKGADGFGLPPVQHNVFDRPLQPGQQFQDYKVLPRTVILQSQFYGGTSLSALHALRSKMITVSKPTSVPGTASPAYLRYTISSSTIELPMYYAGGMEGALRQGVEETAAVKLVAYDPLWRKTTETSCDLAVSQSDTFRYVAGRVDGLWTNLGSPTTCLSGATMYSLAENDTYIFLSGEFEKFGGSANADYIVKLEKSTGDWSPLTSSSPLDGIVYDTVSEPDGAIFTVGVFDITYNGSPLEGAARYSSGDWVSTASKSGGMILTAVSPCGTIYAIDDLIIYRLDGDTWTNVGEVVGAVPAWSIRDMVVTSTGSPIICGNFTSVCSAAAGSATACHLARLNTSTSAWSVVGGDTNATVYSLALGRDNRLYTLGVYTEVGDGIAASRFAFFDWSNWSPITPLSWTPRSATISDRGDLYTGGNWTASDLDRLSRWNGYAWTSMDIDLPGDPGVLAILSSGDDIYLGYDTCGVGVFSGSTAVVNNGNVETYPVFKITGSGTLVSIRNATTGDELFFNLFINTGETITIDLSASGKMITSDFRGNILGELVPMSDFATFHLAPGANTIALYVSSSGAETAACINFREQYWATDGLF